MAAEAGVSARNPQSTCSVCLRPIAVTATGLVRQHGPVASRCPGSRRPPVWPASTPAHPPEPLTMMTRGQDSEEMERLPPSTVFSLPLRTSVNIIKRLPKASRESAARKFAAILEAVV